MTSMFDNADTFLTANSDLFTGLSEDDLNLPERLIFLKGEVVQGTILDISQINTEKFQAVKVELKVETGDHAGKLHELTVSPPKVKDGKIIPAQKKNWVEFLLAFFTKEEILSGAPNFDKYVGAKIEFTAAEARTTSNGNVFQNATKFKLVTDDVNEEPVF